MTVRFRRAGVDDMADIVELSAILFQEDAGERDPTVNLRWPEDEGREYFAGLVDGESSVCLLAEIGGDVVGYLAGRLREGTSLRPGKTAELESMCVREEHRGRGMGEGLIEEFFAWAGARGAERATVTAYAANERAIRLYERRGFRPGACRWRGG